MFGQTYSLNFVKPLLWVHTPLWKKIIRMLIVIVPVIAGQIFLKQLFDVDIDEATSYVVSMAAINLVESYFIFGLYPILCKKMHLVITEE